MNQQYIEFEHPLNERMRTFLRAEHLFQLTKYRFKNLNSPWDSRDCLANAIELYNLIERTEFRSELLKELERHINGLQRLVKTPAVDHQALNKVLRELEHSADVLRNHATKQGYFPKDSEILNALRQRLMIPGGTCSFDIPSFYYWLHLPTKIQQNNIAQWIEMLEPLDKTLSLVLDLTRQSSLPTKEMAVGGTFQKALNAQNSCQLLRLNLRLDSGVYPEISANKYRVNIRFLQAVFDQSKPLVSTQDIPFELTCCMI